MGVNAGHCVSAEYGTGATEIGGCKEGADSLYVVEFSMLGS